MVAYLISALLMLSSCLFSAEFQATVNKNEIALGESINLSLTLKDASPRGNPAIGSLMPAFRINSQQQSAHTSILNGKVTSNITWKVSLTPQKEGELIIPPIHVSTNHGTLSTQPLRIKVSADSAANGSGSGIKGLALTTEVSKSNPYKNEPFFYKIKLTSNLELANVGIHKFSVEDAIVEANGEPQVNNKIIDGVPINIVEFNYLITPLKAGTLHIPPVVVQGGTPQKRKASKWGSFFDDDFDPFFMMPGFDRFEPFSLATKGESLEIQPAVPGVQPWFPAQAVEIEEIFDSSQVIRVGEPFTRSFKITAKGALANQIPSIKDLHTETGFKIYADKPEIQNEVKEGLIQSFKKEQFTLIPQQAGGLTLPEIALPWWDVSKKEIAFAKVPQRSLKIQASKEAAHEIAGQNDSTLIHQVDAQEANIQTNPLLYSIMGILVLLLGGSIIWVIALQKRISKLSESPKIDASAKKRNDYKSPSRKASKPKKDKQEKLPDLNPT